MNTSFEIAISGGEKNYAKSAAEDCFNETEELENILSMYRFGSDISCINSAEAGKIVPLTDIATKCLQLAFAASAMSRGALDVALGEFFLKAKSDKNIVISHPPRRGRFEFDPSHFSIKKLSEGKIDLGSIGKGFAVDAAVERLQNVWEIKNAFLTFGGSSGFAFGRDDNGDKWKFRLGGKDEIEVDNFAVGASGVCVLGNHIIDARTGEIPAAQPFATWAFCASAAIADAMSTAFMILSREETAEICRRENISAAIQQTDGGKIEFFE